MDVLVQRMRLRILIAAAALLSLPLLATASVQPSPGELLFVNNLGPTTTGECSGSVTFGYGSLPQQSVRRWVATPTNSACDVEVVEWIPEEPDVWGPANLVCISMDGSVWDDWYERTVVAWATDCYDYGLVPCLEAPAHDGNTYDFSDERWMLYEHDGPHPNNAECSNSFSTRVGNGIGSPNQAYNEWISMGSTASATVVMCYVVTSDNPGSATCQPTPAPSGPGPFNLHQILGIVESGDSRQFNRGSGL